MVVIRNTSAFAFSRSHLWFLLVTIIRMHPMSALASVKTALVTGSTDGIGLTTAKALAAMGFRVIVHGRDPERVKNACTQVREAGGSFSSAIPALSDISTFEGCKTLADIVSTSCLVQNSPLDLIVNNAGIFLERSSRRETVQWSPEHTLERTFAVNVAATFVITSLLLPLLTAQDGSRIVIVSSISQSSTVRDWQDLQFEKRPFSNHQAYSESKLFDAMVCMEMAERLKVLGTERVTVNCLDPGTVNTKMLLAGWGPCGIDVEDALDETWLSTSSDVSKKTGLYFVGRRERKAAWPAYDIEQRTNLWNILCSLAPDASHAWNLSVNQSIKLEGKNKFLGPS
jgi:NAD(P)-dependent dehydrogenase (short-subunit alcohol dehydrogenase family)